MSEIEERSGAASPESERIPRGAAPITNENGAIEAGDADGVRSLAGRLYEADLGPLTALLEPELRPTLVEMMGSEFDCAALAEMDGKIRDEILAELQNETVAGGVRDFENEDAVSILEDLEPEDQVEILEALPPADRVQ